MEMMACMHRKIRPELFNYMSGPGGDADGWPLA